MNKDTSLKGMIKGLMIDTVPSYANKIYYSLGFLSMTSFMVLIITGVVMVFEGATWWLTNPVGIYFRSIHLWATQAFVLFILLHLTIVFLSSGFRNRKLTWALGALMFFFVLTEAEFGFLLRGDFSSQWRSLQAADFYNGSGLGNYINTLNNRQVLGIHIVLIPLLIIILLFFHYLLVKTKGISTPKDDSVKYSIVKADHNILFLRGSVLVLLILVLALFFKSPYIMPETIQSIALQDPSLMAQTLISELNQTSDTATYMDTIDPYSYDTKTVYITSPYESYIKVTKSPDLLYIYDNESKSAQESNIKQAINYFNNSNLNTNPDFANPLITVISSLVVMGQSGLYQTQLNSNASLGSTYVTRFLSDTGVMDNKASNMDITTQQYGMVRDEGNSMPVGAWWLTPLGFLDNTLLASDINQDRDGAVILGLLLLFLIAVPYIPFINEIPEKLKINKFIWKTK